MKKTRISITDSNGNLHVIHSEFSGVRSAVEWINNVTEYIDVGNDKYLNPKHVVSVRINYDVE